MNWTVFFTTAFIGWLIVSLVILMFNHGAHKGEDEDE